MTAPPSPCRSFSFRCWLCSVAGRSILFLRHYYYGILIIYSKEYAASEELSSDQEDRESQKRILRQEEGQGGTLEENENDATGIVVWLVMKKLKSSNTVLQTTEWEKNEKRVEELI